MPGESMVVATSSFDRLSVNSDSHMDMEDGLSDFEREFLREFHAKMSPSSVDQVREQNRQECQAVLAQSRILAPASSLEEKPLPHNHMDVASSKLIIYEHVYLLPEEVRCVA